MPRPGKSPAWIVASCPFEAVVEDKKQPGQLHLHMEQCNQCGRCLRVAPARQPDDCPGQFQHFPGSLRHLGGVTLSTFAPGKATHINLATHMTPVCDCFGFTSMPILPDAGILGSDDIVALDQATLDVIAQTPLIEENIPTTMEVHTRVGHPFRWLHGPLKDPYLITEFAENLGLGCREYELVDVLPVEKPERASMPYIAAK